jgi:hypothetical protein
MMIVMISFQSHVDCVPMGTTLWGDIRIVRLAANGVLHGNHHRKGWEY